jgi:hypothetical protein
VTQPQNPMDGYQGSTCQEIGRSAPQEQFFEAAFRDLITHHTTRPAMLRCSYIMLQCNGCKGIPKFPSPWTDSGL